MSVESFSPSQVLSITASAAEHFHKQLARSGQYALRVSLKEAGCTGFKYVIDEVACQSPADIEIILENGVKVYLDQTYLSAISGTVIDYVKEGVNYNLVINNPNVKNECGCGESFNV